MKPYNCLLISITLTLTIVSGTKAAFIDHNYYTTDDVSGLSWLDLSKSVNQAYSTAEDIHPSWRYATYQEVTDLFNSFFIGYYSNDSYSMHDLSSTANTPIYSNHHADVERWAELFGVTERQDEYLFDSSGLYEAENGDLRLMGTFVIFFDSIIYGPDLAADFNDYRDTASASVDYGAYYGTFLVRDASIVPLPSAVWLFGSGLIALFSAARRRQTKQKE